MSRRSVRQAHAAGETNLITEVSANRDDVTGDPNAGRNGVRILDTMCRAIITKTSRVE